MRSCKCTCVCLGVNHNDAILLGVRLTKVFLACATTSPGQVASHSKDPLWFSKTCLSYDCSSRTFTQPMMEILFSEAAFWADGSFRWVESMKILSERRVVAASQTSKQNIIFSVVDLFCITRSISMLVDQCNAFVCQQIVANCFIHNLNITRKRNRNDCVCGSCGVFFGCFVGQFVIQNGRMARDPLNRDGKRNRVKELMEL